MSRPASPSLSIVPRAPGDEGLLQRLIARSPGAARELFELFAPQIRRLARRLGLDASDAEDLVQECLLIAWKSSSRVTDPALLRGFVLGIAVNLARSLLRRRRWARRLGLGPSESELLAEDVIGPSDPAATLELRRVFAVLRGLSDELRVAFVLRYVEQLGLEEVAEATGWSLATTKRKLVHARELFVARARNDTMLWDRLSKEERDG